MEHSAICGGSFGLLIATVEVKGAQIPGEIGGSLPRVRLSLDEIL
jgi:hypothetical protein